MTLGCPKQTPRSAGTVTGDTHAANLTGSYSASSDTHAASLTGSNTQALANDQTASGTRFNTQGSTGISVPDFGSDVGTTETQFTNSVTAQPSTATNMIVWSYAVRFNKTTSIGNVTARFKQDGVTIATKTATNSAVGINGLNDVGVITNASAASHTYTVTLQSANNGVQLGAYTIAVTPISLSGSDTHAASLTGTYTASSDTHAAQLTGSSGTCT